MSILTEINENLQKGRSKAVCNLVETALAEKLDPRTSCRVCLTA